MTEEEYVRILVTYGSCEHNFPYKGCRRYQLFDFILFLESDNLKVHRYNSANFFTSTSWDYFTHQLSLYGIDLRKLEIVKTPLYQALL